MSLYWLSACAVACWTAVAAAPSFSLPLMSLTVFSNKSFTFLIAASCASDKRKAAFVSFL